MAKRKRSMIDYPTLLGYMNNLGIKVYDVSQVNCQFSRDGVISKSGSMMVYRGLVNDSIQGSDAIPIALNVPLDEITEKITDTEISNILNNFRQEIRMMKHFDSHP